MDGGGEACGEIEAFTIAGEGARWAVAEAAEGGRVTERITESIICREKV